MKTSTLVLFFIFLSQITNAQARVLDFANNPNLNTSWIVEDNKKRVLELGLKDLSKGNDLLNFRLWTDRQVLDFTMDKKQIVSLNVYYFVQYSPLKSKGKMKYIGTRQTVPFDITLVIWQELMQTGIMYFPDQGKIKDWSMGFDGYECTTELSSDSVYKFGTYWTPEVVQEKCVEAKRIVNFLEFVDNRIGMKDQIKKFRENSAAGNYTYDRYMYWTKNKVTGADIR